MKELGNKIYALIVVPHFHEAITCNNSLTVAVPTPDNMFENGHSQRYIYEVVSIEQHRHSGASLVSKNMLISTLNTTFSFDYYYP